MGKPSRTANQDDRAPQSERALLLSKLSPPVASRFQLQRTQIADRVFNATGVKVILVRGPAGFGKTTALLQLRQRFEQEGTATTWLTLDDADNDPPRFLTYFALALRDILAAAPGDAERIQKDDHAASELAVMLMERISRHREPFVMFLDEFEALRNAAVLALIAQAFERLPVGALVVIGSRSVPEVGLARLRARGQLLEIDPSQLRFSPEETGSFLTQRRGLVLGAEQVKRLHLTTEGWVAALWLASVALERRPDAEAFISGFAGSNAAIADYLAEDVFAGQPQEIRGFLLQTSILDQLTPTACDAICDRNDSAERLASIERANLFLMPLDENRSAYRYHSLFADFLRGQFKRTDPAGFARLHRLASDWFLRTGRPIPAINHAFHGGDLAYAISLLDRHADDLLGRGRLRLLLRWLDDLPAQALVAHPRLRLIHVWAVSFTRGPREALHLIEDLESRPLHDAVAEAQLLAFRPMLLGMTDRVDEAHEIGNARLPMVRREFSLAYGMLAQCLAQTHMILGRFAEARRHADEARTVLAGRESRFHSALAESVEGAIDLMQGRLRLATVRLRAAAGVGPDEAVGGTNRNLFPGVLLAEAIYESGDSEAAERLLSIFVPLVQNLGLADHLINAHVILARILGDRGDLDGSLKMLADLETAGYARGLTRAVACTRLERARRYVLQGDFGAARDQLEQSGSEPFWTSISGRHYLANDLATYAISDLRLRVRSGSISAALPELKQQLEQAEHEQRYRRALKLRILLSEALHRDGQRKHAMRILSRAVSFAAGEGFTRTFLEEGPSVQSLLAEYFQARHEEPDLREDDGAAQWLQKLVQPRPARPREDSDSAVPTSGTAELLTRKEFKVLELLGQGYSNNGMAEKLFVSETTVRTHLRNINVKLQVSSRTQAIVAARRLGLIP